MSKIKGAIIDIRETILHNSLTTLSHCFGIAYQIKISDRNDNGLYIQRGDLSVLNHDEIKTLIIGLQNFMKICSEEDVRIYNEKNDDRKNDELKESRWKE